MGQHNHVYGWDSTCMDGTAHVWIGQHMCGWDSTCMDGTAHVWMGHVWIVYSTHVDGTARHACVDGTAHVWIRGHGTAHVWIGQHTRVDETS